MRDFLKILLVGSSGKGKTYTFRDIDRDSTGFLNIENKPLPFKGAFKYHIRPKTYTEAYNNLIEMAKNPEINNIVIDSFSAYMDLVLIEARRTKKNFDIWNLYNEEIGKMLDLIKRIPKHTFVTAHYEILGIEGTMEKRVKIKGKEFEGQIEKDFSVVLYADSKMNTETNKPEYWYNLFQEGTSAKCPPDLFPNILKIDNNAAKMINFIEEFTGGVKEGEIIKN